MHVTSLATSHSVPQRFHTDGSKVGIEPTCPQTAHGSVLGAHGLAGLRSMAAPKRASFSPTRTVLTLLPLADLVVVVLPWLKPAVFLVAIHAFSGFQPAPGLPETNAAAAGLSLARL